MPSVLSHQLAHVLGAPGTRSDDVRSLAALVAEAYRRADTEREELAGTLEGAARALLEGVEALISSEQAHRALFESSPAPMFVLDRETHMVIAANRAAGQLVGSDPAALVGRPFDRLVPVVPLAPSLASASSRSCARCLGEHRWTRADGAELVIDVMACDVQVADRIACLLLVRDVTAWHRVREAMEESEERYRLLVERSPEAIAVHRNGRLLYLNQAGAQLLGSASPEELVGTDLLSRIHPDSRSLFTASSMPGAGTESGGVECRLVRDDGEVVDVELLSVAVRYNGKPAIQTVARDVTARRRAERQQRENEALLRVAEQRARTTAERMRTVADAAAQVIAADGELALHRLLRDACTAVLPLDRFQFALYEADRDALRYLADPWERTSTVTVPVTGSPDEPVVRGRRPLIQHTPADQAATAAVNGASPVRSSIRMPIVAGDSLLGVIAVQSCVPDLYGPDDAEVLQTLAALAATALRNVRLVEEIRRSEERLAYQAYHDPLTDLSNRIRFQERVTQALSRSEGRADTVAVLFLDLDDFKTVNDSLGHQEGDRLLVAAASRLLNATRGSDTVARLGGDEFAVLLENVRSESDMLTVAARISHALRAPFALEGKEVFVAASIGIARATAGVTTDELLRNADAAMYAAKTRGKGQYAIFEPSMHAAIVARLELEADLRRAVSHDEFRLLYQPIVELATGRLVGMEALLRWEHAERGVVLPHDFVPFAEEVGLIVPIGRWVLREACRQAAAWRREFPEHPVSVTVNLSGRQLREVSLPHDVRTALAESGLPGTALVLEITESVLMQDTEAALLKLQALKALGVSLAIDDFGTGYSSLGYLQRFPIDILKIDRSFVEAIGLEGASPALARAIIALGDSLEMRTVAEGIEREEQVQALRAMRCELGQGYRFAAPLPAEGARELLERAARGVRIATSG